MADERYIFIQTYHIDVRDRILKMLDDLKKSDKTVTFEVVLSTGEHDG